MLIPEGLKSTNTPAGSASIPRFNRSAVPLSVSPATGDCVTCNATSESDGDVTCTRAEPGPATTRCVGQSPGTVSATRPSTRNVVGVLSATGTADGPRLVGGRAGLRRPLRQLEQPRVIDFDHLLPATPHCVGDQRPQR